MAFKPKVASKHEAAKEEPQKRHPDFNIRVKVKDATGDAKAVWITVGAMWQADLGDGELGWSMKFNALPPGWNGDALAMPPLPEKE